MKKWWAVVSKNTARFWHKTLKWGDKDTHGDDGTTAGTRNVSCTGERYATFGISGFSTGYCLPNIQDRIWSAVRLSLRVANARTMRLGDWEEVDFVIGNCSPDVTWSHTSRRIAGRMNITSDSQLFLRVAIGRGLGDMLTATREHTLSVGCREAANTSSLSPARRRVSIWHGPTREGWEGR